MAWTWEDDPGGKFGSGIPRNLGLSNFGNTSTLSFDYGRGQGFGSESNLADALRAPADYTGQKKYPWMADLDNPHGSDIGNKYLNKDFLGGVGSAMEGLGSLARGWAAMKNLKLTRQAMENQQNQWTTNYEAQRLAANNQIANQNAWKQAQGRTDFGSYVGGKPAGTQYVG
jgi:hypothetical protein